MMNRKNIFNNKGQSLVETALVLPILLLLIFGIIEFGRIFNAYIIISNASREGARYAAVGKTDAEVRTAVLNRTSSLGDGDADDDNDVDIDITPAVTPPDRRTQGEGVDVTVAHDLPLIAPIIGPLISDTNTFHIETTTKMRVE